MDKISSIVPGSQRVKTVDLSEAPPVRPGTPGFGRRQGVSSLDGKDRDGLTTAAKAVMEHKQQMEKRLSESARDKIADEMSAKFFMKKQMAETPTMSGPALSEQISAEIPSESIFGSSPALEPDVDAQAPAFERPGEFIDVRV
jgi:hypothetical protein